MFVWELKLGYNLHLACLYLLVAVHCGTVSFYYLHPDVYVCMIVFDRKWSEPSTEIAHSSFCRRFGTVWFITQGLKPIDYRRRLYSYTLNIVIIVFHICDQLCRYSVFVKYGAYEYV